MLESGTYNGNIRITAVTYSKAVTYFLKSNMLEEARELAKSGKVEFIVCNNALRMLGYESSDIVDFARIVPSGVAEIVKLENIGYRYVKLVQ